MGRRDELAATLDGIAERLAILRAQAGDRQAFAELVERRTPGLRYYLGKLLGQGPRAEDFVQETWLVAWRQLGTLAQAAAFGPWLYRIARNLAVRDLRRRRTEPWPTEEPSAPAAPDPVIRAEEAERVHAALDRLPTEQREALVLRFVEGMDYEEIAAVVGCPLGTVRSRLHQGKTALRRLLDEPS